MDTLIYLIIFGIVLVAVIFLARYLNKDRDMTYFDREYKLEYSSIDPQFVNVYVRMLVWGDSWTLKLYRVSRNEAHSWILQDKITRTEWAKDRVERKKNKRVEYL